jgi:hypothetical protein
MRKHLLKKIKERERERSNYTILFCISYSNACILFQQNTALKIILQALIHTLELLISGMTYFFVCFWWDY